MINVTNLPNTTYGSYKPSRQLKSSSSNDGNDPRRHLMPHSGVLKLSDIDAIRKLLTRKLNENSLDSENTNLFVGTYDPNVILEPAMNGVIHILMYDLLYQKVTGDCSGTVIEHKDEYSIVSTAAHCLNTDDNYRVRFAVSNGTLVQMYCTGNPKFYEFTEINYPAVAADYGACVTKTRLVDEVIPDCGFSNTAIEPFLDQTARISGFGGTGALGYCNETSAEKLDDGSYSLIRNNGTSSDPFFLNNVPYYIFYNVIAIPIGGSGQLQSHTCPGDSGGAGLVVTGENGNCQLAITNAGTTRNDKVIQIYLRLINNELVGNRTALVNEAIDRRDLELFDFQTIPPTASPTGRPSSQPTGQPSRVPSGQPTGQPSRVPSGQPTGQPSRVPSGQPTGQPSRVPSGQPTGQPSSVPTGNPTASPVTSVPTNVPVTSTPTGNPTASPVTSTPTGRPTNAHVSNEPTGQPLEFHAPSPSPTSFLGAPDLQMPSAQTTVSPTIFPTVSSNGQLDWPTMMPSLPSNQTDLNTDTGDQNVVTIAIGSGAALMFVFVCFIIRFLNQSPKPKAQVPTDSEVVVLEEIDV